MPNLMPVKEEVVKTVCFQVILSVCFLFMMCKPELHIVFRTHETVLVLVIEVTDGQLEFILSL